MVNTLRFKKDDSGKAHFIEPGLHKPALCGKDTTEAPPMPQSSVLDANKDFCSECKKKAKNNHPEAWDFFQDRLSAYKDAEKIEKEK